MKIEGSLFEEEEEKEEEIASCLIDIKGYAEPSGPHSFFLKAEITGHIRCHCDACGTEVQLTGKIRIQTFPGRTRDGVRRCLRRPRNRPVPSLDGTRGFNLGRSELDRDELKGGISVRRVRRERRVVETWSLDYDGEVKIKK